MKANPKANPKVTEALEPTWELIRDRVAEQLHAMVLKIYTKMGEHEWDVNAAYPYPRAWNMGRVQYKQAVQEHKAAQAWTAKPENAPVCRPMNAPDYRVPRSKEDLDSTIMKMAENHATNYLESYALKLTQKLKEHFPKETPVWIFYSGSTDPWARSTLTAHFSSGEVGILNTRVIINCSCLGTVFNQFPTRKG